MSIDLRAVSEGVVIAVQAQPGARRNGVAGVHDGRIKIAVTQVAEKGKANQEIIKLLAKLLNLPKSSLRISAGETSPRKSIHVQGISIEEVRDRLSAILPEDPHSG